MSKRYRIPFGGGTNLKGIRHKKHRFPVKLDDLNSFLDEYKITQITRIVCRLRTSRDILISARYTGEFHWDRIKDLISMGLYRNIMKDSGITELSFGNDIGKSEIYLYSVRPEDEEIAREALLQDAIPLLCEWLAEAEKQTYNWRRNDHNIVFKFKKQQLSFTLEERDFW